MRVNEVICRCRTDQPIVICYDVGYHICGTVYDIIDTEEYKENRIGDMLVMRIGTYVRNDESCRELYIKAVSV